MTETFGELLRQHREAAGLTQSALAGMVGVDQSYITRLEHASRQPPERALVANLADALKLDVASRQRLLVAAGHVPDWLLALPADDPTLLAVAQFLTASDVSEAAKNDLRAAIHLLVARWRRDEPAGS